jgi:hypothetical protein
MRTKPCTSMLTKLVLGGGLEGATCCGARGLIGIVTKSGPFVLQLYA